MRVYLPATSTTLRRVLAEGALGPAPMTGFAVTPALREWYVDDEIEELEYAASLEAARASLRLVDLDGSAAKRRVVVAADVPDSAVEVRDDLERGAVRVNAAVPLADIASVHVDDAEAAPAVAAAAEAIVRADLGDNEAQDLVDDVEGFELSWFASQEIEAVLGQL